MGDPLIPCQGGQDFVYEIGENDLGVWIHNARPQTTYNRLKRKWPTISLPQMGEDEAVIQYPLSGDFETDCQFLGDVKAIKRRRLSPSQRKEADERLRKFRFGPAAPLDETGLKSTNGPESMVGPGGTDDGLGRLLLAVP